MEIRQAELEDIIDISRIYALSWKSAYNGIVPQPYLDGLKEDFWVSSFTEWIKEDVLTARLIFDNGSPVGCIAYGKSRDESLTDWGEIISLYLLPEYFGKGYGRSLILSALEDLRLSGYKSIYLWVLKENIRARDFYEKIGFSCASDEYMFEIMGKRLTDIKYMYRF